MSNELFIIASRKKYRFPCVLGNLTTEQLWELPLTSERANVATLDNVAKSINAEAKNAREESFVAVKSSAATELENKLEIVKYIISVRLAELETAKQKRLREDQRALAKEILASKQIKKMQDMSEEDLRRLAEGE